MGKSILKGGCIGLVLFASSLCANEDQHAIERVIQRAYTSISRIEEGKIFLKPERLKLKLGRIYVEDIDGTEFSIPAVFSSDELLPYMQTGEIAIFNVWICECNAWNHKWDNPTHCWRCGKPR